MRVGAAALAGRRLMAERRLALPSLTPKLRRRVLALVAVALLLAAGYQFWLRDSSFVAVEEVKVTGLTTEDGERVRAALVAAGGSMTTLHVDREVLDEAIAHYPVVRDLEVRSDFPHGLAIRVLEHHPAALIELGGRRVPVAGDGTILRGLPVEGRLPAIAVDDVKGARGDRLADAQAVGAARIAGAAPAPLRRRVEAISVRGGDGLVATLSDGPELIFGDSSRAHAKWIAAARVLADPEADGATYLDLRLPDRPAAGGLPALTVTPVAPAGQTALGTLVAAGVAGATGTDATGATAIDPATTPVDPATTPQTPTTTPAPAPTGVPETAPQDPAAGVPPAGQTGTGGTGAPAG